MPERGYILLFTLDAGDFISPLDSSILQMILFSFLLIALIFVIIAHTARSFSSTITDRKTAENLLLESEGKYKSLFKNMASGFAFHEIIVDENNAPVDYRYIDVNPAFERLVGLKASDILGKSVKSILTGYDEYWINKFGKVAMDGEPCTYEQYDGMSGQYFETSVYSPRKGFFAVLFNDITQRKKAEAKIMGLNAHLEDMVKKRTKQLSEANHDFELSNSNLDRTIVELRNTQSQLIISEKMAILGQLAAGVAHEINTPLGAILSSAKALLRSSFNDSVELYR